MSYDITLNDPVTKEVIKFDTPHQMKGGTYCMGGTTEAWLNITYNYANFYYKIFGEEGLRFIRGKMAAETIPLLKSGCDKLKDDVTSNYWDPTEGNAKRALLQLIALGTMRPDGIWDID